jgi:ectoine hydroxylase-related dioxygenase (phytanoyl-CoA dioxygenase family)
VSYSPPWRLTRDGFELVTDAGLSACLRDLAAALDTRGVVRSRAGARHVLRLPEVATLAREPRLLEAARGAVGPGAVAFSATLFDKSPRANWLVTWHQDTALPMRWRHGLPGWTGWSMKAGVLHAHAPACVLAQIVAIRVHLDDSVADNGPLRVLPGTHLRGVLGDDALGRLAAEQRAVECLVPAGGLILMRPLIVHASSKATSTARRRVLHLEYASSLVVADGAELATA